jgi:hypothetical protein
MALKLTTSDVIKRFKSIHGDRYDYSEYDYKGTKLDKSTVICKDHGRFEINRMHHERGCGCPTCSNVPAGGHKRKTKSEFLNSLDPSILNCYDFSKFDYVNNRTKSTVICSAHGEFLKSPKKLLLKQGCPVCSGKAKLSSQSLQIAIPNYDFSKFDYVNNKTPGVVICPIHGEWTARADNLMHGETRCPACAGSLSKIEADVREYVQSLGVECLLNKQNIIPSKLELDIYIPKHSLAIELDGLYTHSENTGKKTKHYHLLKTTECEELKIQLLHIFEDEWRNNNDLCKSIIRNKLKLNTQKIFARKCIIKELTVAECSKFFNENHIQGYGVCKYRYGLFFQDELLTSLTICKSRFDKSIEYEISRFATKMDCNIVGGFSKLLSFFIKTQNPKSIVTYADRRYSVGDVYKKYGMVEMKPTAPSYTYFKKRECKRFSRMQFQKHKLAVKLENFDESMNEWNNMLNNGYDRIWDCGNRKFVWYNRPSFTFK